MSMRIPVKHALCVAAVFVAGTVNAQSTADFQYKAPTVGPAVGPGAAKYKLGAYMTPIQYYEPQIGGYVNAMRIDAPIKFSPAQRYGLESGDILTRIDGVPVRNFIDLRNQINASSGTVTLRIRDIRSGTYSDMLGVVLEPIGPPPGPGGGGGGSPVGP